MSDKKTSPWFVYIIEADDRSLYTGISTDIDRRFREHCDKTVGARYFNGRKPVEVVYRESGHNRSTASKREIEIKKLSRRQKLSLISTQLANPQQA
ncbi:MAG: GIY-YIG nuclease family protein [Gammaproteobacteria bacterium]|nr:GIY-YIG nuclease family protein [Gammaproteobacteria bacterium]